MCCTVADANTTQQRTLRSQFRAVTSPAGHVGNASKAKPGCVGNVVKAPGMDSVRTKRGRAVNSEADAVKAKKTPRRMGVRSSAAVAVKMGEGRKRTAKDSGNDQPEARGHSDEGPCAAVRGTRLCTGTCACFILRVR